MSVKLRREQCCCVDRCLRPARDFGYCSACWRGLSPESRAVARWEAGIRPVVRSEVRLLTPREYAAREHLAAASEALIASETAAGIAALEAWLRDAA